MSTKRGRVASARATPRRRSSPWARLAAGASAYSREAERRRARRRPAPAPRAATAPTPRAATSTFSRTERPRKAWLCWNVRVETGPAAAVGAPARSRRARSSSTVPSSARSKPGQQVDERRLARAVRPDQPDDLVVVELEVDAGERLHALEGPRDRGGPERVSGPPRAFRLRLDARQDVLDLRDDLRGDRADLLRLVVLDPDHAVLAAEHRVQAAA